MTELTPRKCQCDHEAYLRVDSMNPVDAYVECNHACCLIDGPIGIGDDIDAKKLDAVEKWNEMMQAIAMARNPWTKLAERLPIDGVHALVLNPNTADSSTEFSAAFYDFPVEAETHALLLKTGCLWMPITLPPELLQ